MTLAAILLFGLTSISQILWRMPLMSYCATLQSAPTQEKTTAPDQNQTNQTPSQNPAGPAQTPASTPGTNPPAKKKPAHATKPQPKHSRLNPNCNPTPPAKGRPSANLTPGTSTQTTKSGSADNAGGAKTSSPATAGKTSPAANCPPPKIVIQQGGTKETTIQLVGGGATPAQASDERQTATQMLQSTEVNLKKMEGAQLNPNQQEMIQQVHQFVDQSKAATTAGDLDRARTLAWKAQLLSEELVTPPK